MGTYVRPDPSSVAFLNQQYLLRHLQSQLFHLHSVHLQSSWTNHIGNVLLRLIHGVQLVHTFLGGSRGLVSHSRLGPQWVFQQELWSGAVFSRRTQNTFLHTLNYS